MGLEIGGPLHFCITTIAQEGTFSRLWLAKVTCTQKLAEEGKEAKIQGRP